MKSPIKKERSREIKGYRYGIYEKLGDTQKRLVVGIPVTGTLRAEWVFARYGQMIPCNWSQMDFIQWVDQYSPIRFMVADARNVIVKNVIELKAEWLCFIDHDVVLPPLFLVNLNDYMMSGKVPVMSGLYFTKSIPSEPLVYRGRGNGYYTNWKIGDKVWVDGVPMGCTLIHGSILKALWKESEEYRVANIITRRVFETPQRVFYDPESHTFNTQSGTEDLEFCSRVIRDKIFKKAGWPDIQRKPFPFLIDTKLFCWHIREDGFRFPAFNEHLQFVKGAKFIDPWEDPVIRSQTPAAS